MDETPSHKTQGSIFHQRNGQGYPGGKPVPGRPQTAPLPAKKRRKSIGGPWKRGSINSKGRDDTDHDQNEEDGSKAEGNFIFLDEVHRVFLQDSKNEATKKPKKTIFHFGGIRRSERSVQSAKKDSLFPISNWVNDS